MNLKRVTPHPDRFVVDANGDQIATVTVVDLDNPFYAARLRDGDIKLHKPQKRNPPKKEGK